MSLDAQQIISGLVARGLPLHVAQGIAANMKAESRLDPGINEIAPLVPGSRGGFGLNQWTGPRRRALEAAAAKRGVPVSDLDFQLDYTLEELRGPENKAFQALQGAKTAEEAARIYSDRFLRPGIPHMDKRLEFARQMAGVEPTGILAASAGQTTMTGGGGMDTMQKQRDHLLFPNMNPDRRDRLIMALEGMTLNPNEALVQSAQARIGDRRDQARLNQTVEWLRTNGAADLADALATGAIDPGAAVQAHMQRQEQAQAAAGEAQKNAQLAEMIRANNPQVADMLAAGLIGREDALKATQGDPETTTAIKEYQYAVNNDGFTGTLQDWKTQQARAGATQITNTVGESDTFYKELDKGSAQTFTTLMDQGVQAQQSIPRIERLGQLLDAVPTGATAAMKRAAGEYGINTEGLSDIQAAEALIQQLVPLQRPPGSGPMSDKDIEMFRASLPRLINTPDGNRKIVQTMQAMAQYQVEQGRIAAAVANRQMTPEQGRTALMALPNPLADFTAPPATNGAKPRRKFNPETGRLE